MSGDARDFNNIETRAVIEFFFFPARQGALVPVACFFPGRAKVLSAPPSYLYFRYLYVAGKLNKILSGCVEEERVKGNFKFWTHRPHVSVSTLCYTANFIRNVSILRTKMALLSSGGVRPAGWDRSIIRKTINRLVSLRSYLTEKRQCSTLSLASSCI
jgi:hypothetical protein